MRRTIALRIALSFRGPHGQGILCYKLWANYFKPKKKGFQVIHLKAFTSLWCEPGSNRRHMDFQSIDVWFQITPNENT